MTWHTQAACRGMDIAIFYPVPEEKKGRHPTDHVPGTLYEQARTICNGCPVKDECLHDAMAEEHGAQRFGFRGGLTWRERGALLWRVCQWCAEQFPVEPIPCADDVTKPSEGGWRPVPRRLRTATAGSRQAGGPGCPDPPTGGPGQPGPPAALPDEPADAA